MIYSLDSDALGELENDDGGRQGHGSQQRPLRT